jgi:hypothetical protein
MFHMHFESPPYSREYPAYSWLADFGFFAWPEPGIGSYSQVREETLAYEEDKMGLRFNGTGTEEEGLEYSSWDKKIKKLMWRGVPMVEVRQVSERLVLVRRFWSLRDQHSAAVRSKLSGWYSQDLMRASNDQPWSDVRELNWGAVNQEGEERMKNHGDLKSIAEHCEYAFLAHVEGWAYSGRLKWVLRLAGPEDDCRRFLATSAGHPQQFYHRHGVHLHAHQVSAWDPLPPIPELKCYPICHLPSARTSHRADTPGTSNNVDPSSSPTP